MDARQIPGMGLGRADRDLRRAVPDAERAAARDSSRPRVSRPRSKNRPWPSIPHPGQKAEQLPTYNVYSIDGDVTALARLRELRASGGLRRARSHRRLGSRRHRHRPLRRIVPRHQAEDRRRARRRRLHHLLRSARRRIFWRRCVSRTGRCATSTASQRGSVHGLADLLGRSADAGIAAVPGARRLAIRTRRRSRRFRCCPISYGDAQPLLAAMQRTGRAGRLAWRSADHVSLGPGPARVHLKVAFNWDTKPIYNVVARITGARRFPTSGSFAAIITTRG